MKRSKREHGRLAQWRAVMQAALMPASMRMSPLARSSLLVMGVFVVGTLGYYVLSGPEYGVFDAVYMTAITLTTVGYGESIDMSGNTPARAFTVVLLVCGVGTFVYFFSTLTSFIVEGSLDRLFVRHRMRAHIAQLHDHYIVCGAGHTGRHVIDELVATKRPLVVVERDPEVAHRVYDSYDGRVPVVVGDASEDENLEAAGVDRAHGLVTCFTSDKDNLIVAFSARALNAELRIVGRSLDERAAAKMRRAGADAVVSPANIGGLRMVAELTRPKAVSFLDGMLREHPEGFRVEDLTVEAGSAVCGLTLRELRGQKLTDVLVLALHPADGAWRYNPDGAARLEAGTSVVFIASPELRDRFESLATAP